MVADPAARAIPLDYQSPHRPTWPAYCAVLLFQLGVFATMAASLMLGDQSEFCDWMSQSLPAWLARAGVDISIFCWIGHTVGLIAFVVVGSCCDGPSAARHPFVCLIAGMLYPLFLLMGVHFCAAMIGGGAEGAAIVFLAPLLAAGAGAALVRRAQSLTSTTCAALRSACRTPATIRRR